MHSHQQEAAQRTSTPTKAQHEVNSHLPNQQNRVTFDLNIISNLSGSQSHRAFLDNRLPPTKTSPPLDQKHPQQLTQKPNTPSDLPMSAPSSLASEISGSTTQRQQQQPISQFPSSTNATAATPSVFQMKPSLFEANKVQIQKLITQSKTTSLVKPQQQSQQHIPPMNHQALLLKQLSKNQLTVSFPNTTTSTAAGVQTTSQRFAYLETTPDTQQFRSTQSITSTPNQLTRKQTPNTSKDRITTIKSHAKLQSSQQLQQQQQQSQSHQPFEHSLDRYANSSSSSSTTNLFNSTTKQQQISGTTHYSHTTHNTPTSSLAVLPAATTNSTEKTQRENLGSAQNSHRIKTKTISSPNVNQFLQSQQVFTSSFAVNEPYSLSNNPSLIGFENSNTAFPTASLTSIHQDKNNPIARMTSADGINSSRSIALTTPLKQSNDSSEQSNSSKQQQLHSSRSYLIRMKSQFDSSKSKKSYCDLQDLLYEKSRKPIATTSLLVDQTPLPAISSSRSITKRTTPLRQSQQLPNSSQSTMSRISSFSPYDTLTPDTILRLKNPFLLVNCEEIEESLKRDLPNSQSNVPSNRSEALILNQWFQSTKINQDENQLFKCLSVALNELIRQISLDCQERAHLLKEVLSSFTSHCWNQFEKQQEEYSSEISRTKEEMQLNKKFFQNQLVEKEFKISETLAQFANSAVTIEAKNKEIQDLLQKQKESYTHMNHYKSLAIFLHQQVKTVTHDNLKLRIKLKKRKSKQTHQSTKQSTSSQSPLQRPRKQTLQQPTNQSIDISMNTNNNKQRPRLSSISKSTKPNQSVLQPRKTLISKSTTSTMLSTSNIKKQNNNNNNNNNNKNGKKRDAKTQSSSENSSDSDSSSVVLKDIIDHKEEFSLNEPYILKHTVTSTQTPSIPSKLALSSSNLAESRKQSISALNFSFERKSRISISSATGKALLGTSQQQQQHLIDFQKKNDPASLIAAATAVIEAATQQQQQLAILEQKGESDVTNSSISSEDSKLILDEAQNELYNIEQLNAVGFLDPETAIRRECAETQVNDSLLALTTSTVALQTDLILFDSKYDEFLAETGQVDYLIENWIRSEFFNHSNSNNNSPTSISPTRLPAQQGGSRPRRQLLKNPISSYKGRFNQFEKLYEQTLEETTSLKEKMNQDRQLFAEKESKFIAEIAQMKAQLKAEFEFQIATRKQEISLEDNNIILNSKELSGDDNDKHTQSIPSSKQPHQPSPNIVPEKWKHYQLQANKKKADALKQTNAPRLGVRVGIDIDGKQQSDFGEQIVEKLQNKKYQKFKNFMPLSTLMKQINLIYVDRLKLVAENQRFREVSCANFSYIFLTKLFGLKKIVDQKFIIFILSLKKYLQIFRVNMFARYLGILEQKSLNYSLDEFNKYIETLDFVHNQCTIGKDLETVDSDTKYFVHYLRVASFVSKIQKFRQKYSQKTNTSFNQSTFADSRMSSEETIEFKKEIDRLKENDPRYPNSPVVDFDLFVHKMLNKHKMLVNRAKLYVINAFDASDLDGNGLCNLEEFLILNRNIEAATYNEEILTNIFNDNADDITDEESNLTFDKFAVVCVDFNLFSDEQQDAFLNIKHKREIEIKFDEVRISWVTRLSEYTSRINSLSNTDLQQRAKWSKIASILDERIRGHHSQQELKPLLIAERILDREIEYLEICGNQEDEVEQAIEIYQNQKRMSQNF